MSTTEDKLGVVRDHRWVSAAVQRKRLEEDGCRGILELDGKKNAVTQNDIIRMSTIGRTFVFVHAFFLADPSFRKKRGGLVANFDAALAEIAERGGAVKDLETGLSTADRQHRKAIIAISHRHIARSNQGLRSSINGKKSRGRPMSWSDPKDRQTIWDEWHSNAHATNTAAADEASRKMGRRITHYVMWRIAKQMREERGLKGLGASGRRPGSAAAALAALVGKPSDDRPLPKARVRRGVVYFVKNGSRDRVKIGFSTGHKGRIGSLQNASPDKLTLIGVMPGDVKLERKMHARFKEYREVGEWFRIEGALAKFLRTTFSKFKRK